MSTETVAAQITAIAQSLSPTAMEAIRLSFNPSGDPNVILLKTVAATFITLCERMSHGQSGREAAVAITNMQTASMWAVLGATKGK